MSDNTVVDMTKFEIYLEEKTEIYLNFELLLKEVEKVRNRRKYLSDYLKESMYPVLNRVPKELTKQTFIEYLDKCGVSDKLLYNSKTGNEKTNQKSLGAIIANRMCVDECELHMEVGSLGSYISLLDNVVMRSKDNKVVDGYDGVKLTTIPFSVTPTYNRRYSTKQENVIGFYGDFKSAMSVKDGYLLVSADFPQIDGKGVINTYLGTNEVHDIISVTDDTYLTFKEFVRNVNHLYLVDKLNKLNNSPDYNPDIVALENKIKNFVKDVVQFTHKEQRDDYKVIALSTAYGAMSNVDRHKQILMQQLKKTLKLTGRYRIIEEIISYFHEIHYPLIAKSRWGYTRVINKETLIQDSNAIFNTPIQTTSSEIVSHYVVTILDYFRSKGYGVDDIRLYMNRHDEPMFEVKREVFLEHYKYFKEMSNIVIHGWREFKIKWSVGKTYREHDEELTALIEDCFDDIEIAKQVATQHKHVKPFFPLELPEIYALDYRIIPDGDVYFVMSRSLGEFPTNEYYFDKYKDTRNIEYTIIKTKMPNQNIDFNYLSTITSKMLSSTDMKGKYIVNIPPNIYGGSKQLELDGRNVFMTGHDHDLSKVNKVIIAQIMNTTHQELMTDAEISNFKHVSKLEGRLVARGMSA